MNRLPVGGDSVDSGKVFLNRRPDSPMIPEDLVLYDEEFQKIRESLQRLLQDASAKLVFLVDKNGQQIAAVGEMNTLDTTSLASLTAGNVAATDGLARLIGEKEFSILFHEGEKDNIHISIAARRRSSTGSSKRSPRRSSARKTTFPRTSSRRSPKSPTTTSTASSRSDPGARSPRSL